MTEEERWKGIAVYALYLIALFTAVPWLIGVILAYLFRSSGNPMAVTHFEHQIGLFWRFLFGTVISGVMAAIGWALTATIVLSVVGIPLIIAAGIFFVWSWVMMLTRSINGILRLNRGEGYPIPAGWRLA